MSETSIAVVVAVQLDNFVISELACRAREEVLLWCSICKILSIKIETNNLTDFRGVYEYMMTMKQAHRLVQCIPEGFRQLFWYVAR